MGSVRICFHGKEWWRGQTFSVCSSGYLYLPISIVAEEMSLALQNSSLSTALHGQVVPKPPISSRLFFHFSSAFFPFLLILVIVESNLACSIEEFVFKTKMNIMYFSQLFRWKMGNFIATQKLCHIFKWWCWRLQRGGPTLLSSSEWKDKKQRKQVGTQGIPA